MSKLLTSFFLVAIVFGCAPKRTFSTCDGSGDDQSLLYRDEEGNLIREECDFACACVLGMGIDDSSCRCVDDPKIDNARVSCNESGLAIGYCTPNEVFVFRYCDDETNPTSARQYDWPETAGEIDCESQTRMCICESTDHCGCFTQAEHENR